MLPNEEIDEIWEVEFFGSYSYWVTEETYEKIKKLLLSNCDKANTATMFNTIHGAEYVILLSNISDLCYSTKAIRTEARELKKFFQAEREKEEWEK